MAIKNVVTVSLMIFILAVVIILGVNVFFYQAKPNSTLAGQPAVSVTISSSDVAKHNTSNDCWVIVSNKVYNVTSFIPMHPGGPQTIVPYCGKDATVAFETKGGRGPHSQRASDVLNTFYVGNLK